MPTPKPPAHPLPPSGVSAAELLASCAAASAVSTPPARRDEDTSERDSDRRPVPEAGTDADAGTDDEDEPDT